MLTVIFDVGATYAEIRLSGNYFTLSEKVKFVTLQVETDTTGQFLKFGAILFQQQFLIQTEGGQTFRIHISGFILVQFSVLNMFNLMCIFN